MTKSQMWVAGFLLAFLVLFVLSQVTKNDEPVTHPGGMPSDTEQGSAPSSNENALTLIKKNGCTSCHGSDLRGSNLGPNLMNVKQNWDSREELISYLRNPSSFMDKDRFRKYKEQYPSVVMPPFNYLDIKDLGKIADYLRGL